MKANLPRLAAWLSLAIIFLTFYSCKKDPNDIGYTLLPGSDTLNVRSVDTVTIIAYSLIQDSIRTDKRTENMVGSMVDPVFGVTSANYYTQFRLSAESNDFGSNPVMDSIVLQLRYSTIYGDTNTLQTLKVYEMSQDLSYDSTYYSNQSIAIYGNLLASYTFRPKPKDSVLVKGVKTAPHIRINLSKMTNYFGNKILFTPADVINSNLSFIKYMKGLAIQSVPVSSGGALISILPIDANSKLVLYFHNDSTTYNAFDMPVNSLCARMNQFDHNGYLSASPELKNQILNKDTLLGKEKLYIQGLGGVQTKIRIPYIKELRNLGKIAINNALLVLKNIEFDTTYAPVPAIYLLQKDSLGRFANVLDYVEGANYFGGVYDKNKKTYTIRLTRHIENILLGKVTNHDLYLMASHPSGSTLVPNRVIVRGTNPSDPTVTSDRIQLQIVYTKLY